MASCSITKKLIKQVNTLDGTHENLRHRN